MAKTEVYLEVGKKKVIAAALDWPGWCRIAGDEEAALATLVEYAPRYAKIVGGSKTGFTSPDSLDAFTVVERLQGNASSDFGVPALTPSRDETPFDAAERERSEKVFEAIWRSFDRAIAAAEGKELRRGPRGGGRDLEGIVRHVLGADTGYLRQIGRKVSPDESAPLYDESKRVREAIHAGLLAGERGEIPEKGPRGGKMWTPRYYVRRAAWHTVDHLWEIEDRII